MVTILAQVLSQGYWCPQIDQASDEWSMSDILSAFAIFLSIVSLLFSYYSIHLSKRVEINFLKFDRLCIENINKLYTELDILFESNSTAEISTYLALITENLVEVELFLIKFTDIFDQLELLKITETNANFSDMLYINSRKTVKQLRTDYLSYKSKVVYELYEYALNNSRLRVKLKLLIKQYFTFKWV